MRKWAIQTTLDLCTTEGILFSTINVRFQRGHGSTTLASIARTSALSIYKTFLPTTSKHNSKRPTSYAASPMIQEILGVPKARTGIA